MNVLFRREMLRWSMMHPAGHAKVAMTTKAMGLSAGNVGGLEPS